MLLELALGGELFTLLAKRAPLFDSPARFYASSVVSMFSYMHSLKVRERPLSARGTSAPAPPTASANHTSSPLSCLRHSGDLPRLKAGEPAPRRQGLPQARRFRLREDPQRPHLDSLWYARVPGARDHPQQRPRLWCRLVVCRHPRLRVPHRHNAVRLERSYGGLPQDHQVPRAMAGDALPSEQGLYR